MTARYFGLVPAAGSGSRFGADVLKQYSPLAGKPMLHHSIGRLLAVPEVEIAFVVLAPGDTEFRRHDWMLVHDAVRPCLGKPALRRLIDAAGGDEVGGILAIPVADTLKRADDEHRIAATEPRDGLWRAQTPQMFRHSMLLRALREAEHVTDEASAVEALGYKPKLVEGSTKNMKITFAADLEIAERLLREAAK